MNYLDMFHGIGGFPLGAYWAGMKFENHYCSDIVPYAQELYKIRFPDSMQLGDITKINYEEIKDGNEWIITGGFPCQPHSTAGKRQASEDERDLWSECTRAIRILRPRFCIFENVRGLFSSEHGNFFDRILRDLAEMGYDVEWGIISAENAGAPHKRERIWIISYPSKTISKQSMYTRPRWDRTTGVCTDISNASSIRQPRQGEHVRPINKETNKTRKANWIIDCCERKEGPWVTESPVGRLADGVSGRVERLKGLGNAIVPQIAEMLWGLIKDKI